MTNAADMEINGHHVELSNLDKILFPKSEITKKALIDYYAEITSIALPYYKDRPLSMHRFPDGITQEGFFQKEAADYFPDWIETIRIKKAEGTIEHVVANDAATLTYIANLGCITPHLALSKNGSDCPDQMIFDLDPSNDDFSKVQYAAKKLKTILDELKLPAFVKTTGSKGLHIHVPLDESTEFDQVRQISRQIGQTLAQRHPEQLTIEQRKGKRGNRIFIDYLRNAYSQTAVAPYGVRAIEKAPVATPLHWHEVGATDLTPQKYTIANVFRRLGQTTDPWKNIHQRAVALSREISEQLKAFSKN